MNLLKFILVDSVPNTGKNIIYNGHFYKKWIRGWSTWKSVTFSFHGQDTCRGADKEGKKDGDGTISYVVTGKHSYLEESSKALYSYVNDTAGLPQLHGFIR